jgi:hypothetical protein
MSISRCLRIRRGAAEQPSPPLPQPPQQHIKAPCNSYIRQLCSTPVPTRCCCCC